MDALLAAAWMLIYMLHYRKEYIGYGKRKFIQTGISC